MSAKNFRLLLPALALAGSTGSLMPALFPAALLRISKYIAGKHQIRFAAKDGS